MNEIRKVVGATDFSPDAEHALARAVLVAAEQGASLELRHVVSSGALAGLRALRQVPPATEAQVLQRAQEQLEQERAALAAHTTVPVTARLTCGVPRHELVKGSEGSDLLVLGAHGTNPIRDLLLGSTAERILGKIRIPMLIVRQPPSGPYVRVLVPTDFSAGATAAMEAAARIAPGAPLTALHAYDVPFEGYFRIAGASDDEVEKLRAQEYQAAVQELERQLQSTGGSHGRWRQRLARGDPAPVILEIMQHLQPDLVCIGKHGRSLLEEALIGSVTRRVIASAHCDVLVVPSQP